MKYSKDSNDKHNWSFAAFCMFISRIFNSENHWQQLLPGQTPSSLPSFYFSTFWDGDYREERSGRKIKLYKVLKSIRVHGSDCRLPFFLTCLFFCFCFFSQKEMVFCDNLAQLFRIIWGIKNKVKEKNMWNRSELHLLFLTVCVTITNCEAGSGKSIKRGQSHYNPGHVNNCSCVRD